MIRLALALLAVLAAAASSAQAAEDRYGPSRAQPMRLASNGLGGGPYEGRLLTWSSRAFIPQTPEPSLVAAPVPPPETRALAPTGAPFSAPPTARAEPPAIRPRAAALLPQEPPRQSSARPAPAAQAAGLPDSLYAPPPPRAPAPQRLAQAETPPAAPGPSSGGHVHLYSVHRQYGLTPDAIPAPSAQGSNYVLIGVQDSGDGDKKSADDDHPF